MKRSTTRERFGRITSEGAPRTNAQVRQRLAVEHGAPAVLRSECAEMGICDTITVDYGTEPEAGARGNG